MGQPVSRSMCCSARDKESACRRGVSMAAETPHFSCSEAVLPLDLRAKLLVFAPLWPGGSATTAVRRMALAGDGGVYVFRMGSGLHTGLGDEQSPVQLKLEHALRLEDGQSATSLLFRDEDSSRSLIVALAPRPGAPAAGCAPVGHVVRVWGCGAEGPEPERVVEWRLDEGYVASLEGHAAPVTRMAVSSTYLLTADSLGYCHVWQKTRGFAARAEARLHQGGLTDLAVDRLFAYTVGAQDMSVRVWSVPDLKPALVIAAETVEAQGVPTGFGAAFPMSLATAPRPFRLAELTAVRRPVSRWSGSQGSTRNATMPKGMLFVAGSLADGQEVAGAGAGVLMEWSLGPKPACQGVQVAHDSPIISLAYGPYDNGPLITADARGVFRVWDYTPRLWCSQQVDSGGSPDSHNLAVAMDPLNRTVYSIVGDSRLFVWRQHGEIKPGPDDH